MSITNETAKAHANDPAVCCCRFEAGTVVEAANLEDPAIFPDLIDSGLLELPENYLTIGEALGGTLKETLDALSPMTRDNVEGYSEIEEEKEEVVEEEASVVAPVANTTSVAGSTIKIHIAEGKGIDLEIPTGLAVASGAIAPGVVEVAPAENEVEETKVIRTLVKKHYKIDKVVFGEKTEINGTTLTVRTPEEICKEAVETEELVYDMKLDIITPDRYNEYSEAVLDLQPIATKESGELGEGVTRVIDGVVMVLTGTDANGVQIGEFGSSEGAMDTTMMWGRPGAADYGEIFIKGQVTIKEGTNMERPGSSS